MNLDERRSFELKVKQRLPFIKNLLRVEEWVKEKEGPFQHIKQTKGESGHSSRFVWRKFHVDIYIFSHQPQKIKAGRKSQTTFFSLILCSNKLVVYALYGRLKKRWLQERKKSKVNKHINNILKKRKRFQHSNMHKRARQAIFNEIYGLAECVWANAKEWKFIKCKRKCAFS